MKEGGREMGRKREGTCTHRYMKEKEREKEREREGERGREGTCTQFSYTGSNTVFIKFFIICYRTITIRTDTNIIIIITATLNRMIIFTLILTGCINNSVTMNKQ